MFTVGKSFFSESLSKFNVKTIAPLCVIHIPLKMPKISPDTHEPVETNPNFAVIIGAIAAGKLPQLCFNEFTI